MIVQTDPRTPRVVLVGPPGAGKSTIGRKLARELGVELYDTDAGIERETGRTIPDIFAVDGEPEFRRIEERVVRRAVLGERGVVSLGGGAVLSDNTRALLRDRTVVYLEISIAEGLRRTGASNQRPLLNGADPGVKYRKLMRERRPLYREVATVRVRTDGRSPGRVVRMILDKLGMESVAPSADPEPDTAVEAAPAPTGRRSRTRRRARARAAAKHKTTETTEPTPDRTGDPAPRQRSRRARGRRTPNNGTRGESATHTANNHRATAGNADTVLGAEQIGRTGDTTRGDTRVGRKVDAAHGGTQAGLDQGATHGDAQTTRTARRDATEAGVDRYSGPPPDGIADAGTSGTRRRPRRPRRAQRAAGAPSQVVDPDGAETPDSGSARRVTSAGLSGSPSTSTVVSKVTRRTAGAVPDTGALTESDGRDRAADAKPTTGERQSGRSRRRRAPRGRGRAEKQSAGTESEQRT